MAFCRPTARLMPSSGDAQKPAHWAGVGRIPQTRQRLSGRSPWARMTPSCLLSRVYAFPRVQRASVRVGRRNDVQKSQEANSFRMMHRQICLRRGGRSSTRNARNTKPQARAPCIWMPRVGCSKQPAMVGSRRQALESHTAGRRASRVPGNKHPAWERLLQGRDSGVGGAGAGRNEGRSHSTHPPAVAADRRREVGCPRAQNSAGYGWNVW